VTVVAAGLPESVDELDPRFFARAATLARPLVRLWFRYRLRGVENLPAGPCLIVGNHSALGTAEILGMLVGWHDAFGGQRRVVGMMHDFFIRVPGIGHCYRRIGAVRASRENALRALAAGRDVLVFPGGDLDACRPFYKPRAVHFGKRRGYIKVALQAGVPIVPMATIGSHYTWLMAPGGRFLARIGFGRLLRTDRVPLPIGLIAAVLAISAIVASILPFWIALAIAVLGVIPTPARITTELLPPIDVAPSVRDLPDGPERWEQAHRIVHGELSKAVATMRH
jgi:1-acyl-sn-glycerol-3-phosphate acyltransferase